MNDPLAPLRTENAILRERLAHAEAMARRYQDVVDNAVEGIYQATPEGRYLYVNKALARMYGYDSPEELMKVTAQQIWVDPARLQDLRNLMEVQDEVHAFEAQRLRKDGSIIWASANIRVIRDSQGNRLYSEGIVEGITERKLAELSLQAERQGLHTLMDGSPVGVLVVESGSRRVLMANRELQRLTGLRLRPGDGLDHYLASFRRVKADGSSYAPGDVPIARALERGETVRSEALRWQLPDGRELTVLASATPVLGEDGRITAAIAMVQEERVSSPLPLSAMAEKGAEGLVGPAPPIPGIAAGFATDRGRRLSNEELPLLRAGPGG